MWAADEQIARLVRRAGLTNTRNFKVTTVHWAELLMKRTSRQFFAVTFALLALLIASRANAATVSYNDTFGPSAVASPTIVVPLPKFDPALGTLTKVTLTLDAETSAGSISWDNEAGIPSDIDLGIGAEVTAAVPGSPSVLTAVAVPLQVGSGSVDADNDGAADFLGTDAFAVVGGSGNDSDMDMTTAAPDLLFFSAAFFGETFSTEIDSVVETFLSTTGGFGPIDPIPGITEGLVTVTYEYTAVPEPGTLALTVLGAIGLAFAVRRRRK
jgi:hypothetical protein